MAFTVVCNSFHRGVLAFFGAHSLAGDVRDLPFASPRSCQQYRDVCQLVIGVRCHVYIQDDDRTHKQPGNLLALRWLLSGWVHIRACPHARNKGQDFGRDRAALWWTPSALRTYRLIQYQTPWTKVEGGLEREKWHHGYTFVAEWSERRTRVPEVPSSSSTHPRFNSSVAHSLVTSRLTLAKCTITMNTTF